MLLQTVIIGLALAMDAFAVTIANAFAYPGSSRARSFAAPVAFAVFQGLMPLIGYFIGSLAAELILAYSGIVSLVILGVIGAKMISDGIKDLRGGSGDEGRRNAVLGMGAIVLQAIATSIDALAVGVTFTGGSASQAALQSGIIALATLAACSVAWLIGRRFGHLLGARAQIVGGVILICIGLKAMFF